jgi:hypothetical protein
MTKRGNHRFDRSLVAYAPARKKLSTVATYVAMPSAKACRAATPPSRRAHARTPTPSPAAATIAATPAGAPTPPSQMR